MKTVKLILMVGLLISLSACSEIDGSVEDIVKESARETLTAPMPAFTNITKDYYRYYLPPDVGRRSGDEISNILIYNNDCFVLSVNVPNVVKDHYYHNEEEAAEDATQPLFNTDKTIEHFTGTFVDYGNINVDYEVVVLTIEPDLYYLQLTTRYLSFGAVVNKTAMKGMLDTFLRIAKTVRVNYELIAVDFSNREVVNSGAIQALDLFREKKPSSGYMIDLLYPNRQENILPEDKKDNE